jgi:hypothetical protein
MGFLSRINRLHVIAIGGLVFLALLIAFALSVLQPNLQQIKQVQKDQDAQKTTLAQLPQKVSDLNTAQQKEFTAETEAHAFMASMPTVYSNTAPRDFMSMFTLHREFTYVTGPAIYNFFTSRGFVPAGISIPGVELQPVSFAPVLTLPMDGLHVTAKSFPKVLALLGDLKDLPRLGVVNGISLSGTSPNLAVALPMTFYIVTPEALAGAPAALVSASVPAAPPEGVGPKS